MQRLLAVLLLVVALGAPARADDTWSTWNASSVTARDRIPVFTVDGKPFFVYGAAFFYERIPRDEWRDDLLKYKALGINTIDLYVMWNWHEPQEGTIDFTGQTNPRRDLDGLMPLIHQLGFKVILRPGPVIRNEWRNGGYPGYLLQRPEYNMPLHDVLEGRYPATATYQNAHADAAADEWLHNRTHLREAAAWLRTALIEMEPWSHDIIAIALDDDQGAYIDNDTWPAPHWHDYMDWLKVTVQRTVGTRVPLFINTFQMKVTASAPVWAWGNWYQSDAYRIGDHDLSQLSFSTGLLQTQPGLPVMASEFQAGWLQGADEIAPRAAAPENTTLALHQMLQLGAHGVVNFPVQDTLNPAGWEAPWANWFYAWDAAIRLQGDDAARAAPTRAFGDLVRAYGPFLATLAPKSDIAIAWLASAYDPADATNDRIAHLADLTIALQQRCRALALTCRLVDLRYANDADLQQSRFLVIPATGFTASFLPQIENRVRAYRNAGGHVEGSIDAAVTAGARSATAGLHDAALLASPDGRAGVLDVFNAQTQTMHTRPVSITVGNRRYRIPALNVPAGAARDLLLTADGAVRDITPAPARAEATMLDARSLPVSDTQAMRNPGNDNDAFRDGSPTFTLQNARLRVIVSAAAGARAFVFEDLQSHRNLFTTIGALRDDVATPATPSPRDYIAPYTHPIPAGTFNREYTCTQPSALTVRCEYNAPDLAPAPVHFEKLFTLDESTPTLTVDTTSTTNATSLSAVIDTPQIAITYPPDPATTHTTEKHPGYNLVKLSYPANHTTHITFTLQGPPTKAPNRP